MNSHDPIPHRRSHLLIRKYLAPFTEDQIGGQVQAGALAQLAEQMKLQGASAFGKRQIAELVQDHSIDIDPPNVKQPGFACRLLLLQFVDQTHHCEKCTRLPWYPALHPKAMARWV